MINTTTEAGALPEDDFSVPGRDLDIVARFLVPTDAHLARGFLVAAGIAAVVADDQHVQAYDWLAPAMGGVRVLAPVADVEQARSLLEARERGEFTLDDDTDVGVAPD